MDAEWLLTPEKLYEGYPASAGPRRLSVDTVKRARGRELELMAGSVRIRPVGRAAIASVQSTSSPRNRIPEGERLGTAQCGSTCGRRPG
jgi:hypothetical protein